MPRTISRAHPLLLGSKSPRRRDILNDLGIPLVVRGAAVDEQVQQHECGEAYLARIVEHKLGAASAYVAEVNAAGLLVADTIVVVDGEIVGKPRDTLDAFGLLEKLVGREHRVLTRFALALAAQPTRLAAARTVESIVTMRSAERDELMRYAETGEGLDKAGAYAVQGCGAFLIERIDGSHSSVIGLPACEVVVELKRVGLLDRFPLVAAP